MGRKHAQSSSLGLGRGAGVRADMQQLRHRTQILDTSGGIEERAIAMESNRTEFESCFVML